MLDIDGFLTSFEFLARLAALIAVVLSAIVGERINAIFGVG